MKMGSAEKHVYSEVDLRDLPSFSRLSKEVSDVVKKSSWFELYGKDWVVVFLGVSALLVGLWILRYDHFMAQVFGCFLLGSYHSIITHKVGHISAHGGLARSKTVNKLMSCLSAEFVGSFSVYMTHDIHIKVHHPHTNIIGLGDSSTWKVPSVPRLPYMFLLPLILPVITPIVATQLLIENKKFRQLPQFMIVMTTGICLHLYLLMAVSQFSLAGAIGFSCLYRAVFSIPYIHVNIFQHIGLPMYSQRDRPVRIYQMATGCLNLSRNIILETVFGHSIISCHVEHHLFPLLSDNMCLKVKPIVRKYLKDNKLPYQEDSYTGRLKLFLSQYESLMVNAPPITHFVGIQ